MAETKIKTEVAGRVCAIAVEIGATVASGDDVIVVEAMKMEIPVGATAGGKVTSILVKVDDMVAEDDVVAIVTS
jgi:acetyl-CoA carboxylase biotin carboxyl carrier protein